MPFSTNAADMVNTYGTKEMIKVTDKIQPLTNTVNTTVLNVNIDDAEGEIMTKLGCCFDMAELIARYAAGRKFLTFNHWVKVVTRLHLYSSLERDDSQVTKAYADYEKEIAQVCKCGVMLDDLGVPLTRFSSFQFIEDDCSSCSCCCPKTTVGCSCGCCGVFKTCL